MAMVDSPWPWCLPVPSEKTSRLSALYLHQRTTTLKPNLFRIRLYIFWPTINLYPKLGLPRDSKKSFAVINRPGITTVLPPYNEYYPTNTLKCDLLNYRLDRRSHRHSLKRVF